MSRELRMRHGGGPGRLVPFGGLHMCVHTYVVCARVHGCARALWGR